MMKRTNKLNISSMKLKIVIILLFLTQIGLSQGFKSGVLIGFVASQVDGDEWGGYNKVGLQAGGYSRFLFNEKWNLSVELKYIQKGSLHNDKEDPYSYFRIRLNYAEIPVLLNYQMNKRFGFGVGGSYGQLINAGVDDANGSISESQLNYRMMDINAIVAVKYLLNEHFWMDIKVAYSFLSITNTTPYQYNNLVSFGLAYEI